MINLIPNGRAVLGFLGAHRAAAGLALSAAAAAVLYVVVERPEPQPQGAQASSIAWTAEPIQPLPPAPQLDGRKVALGKLFFEDVRLSGLGDQSCASCHDVSTNGALAGPRRSKLDTPTVFNASLNFRLGWEGRDRTLEQQALATLKARMVSNGVALGTMIARVRDDTALNRRAVAVYGRDIDTAIVIDAIAVYERSLLTPGSRFDRWLAGDASALNRQERQGYRRFKELGCTACHQGRNIGGNMIQRHGIFRPLAAPEPELLRVPSLRNVATTAPYFHDGSAPTLENAIARMAASQLDVDLSKEDVSDISAFLRTLTGTYRAKPVRSAP